MTEDGSSGRCRYDEIENRQGQRRHKKPDRIMNPQPADRCPGCTGYEFGHDVTHRKRQERKDERADDVPAGYVEFVQPFLEKRWQELNGCHNQSHDDKKVHNERKLGPLEWLAHAGEYEYPAGHHNCEIPDGEEPPAERAARDRSTR